MSLNKLGRYDLIRVLGTGAMGLVYEGRDPNLDRRVAIKTIKVENLSDEAAAEYEVRFRTEARSAARLQHPNIVSVYDSDRDGDMAFLVMEFVQGDDLKHHLDKGEVYTLEQTLGIMGDLLSALSYAHEQKIVHRDIKPANLLVQASGRIKLADFGVARIQDSGDATRTQGSMVGTLKYMSPEQVQGRPADARADLFAVGIVLHQLLTGKRPFDGDSDFAVIQQIVGHQPAAPTYFNPQLPPAIDAVVARALAKSPDERFPNAQAFLDALRSASQQAADQTMVPPSGPPVQGASATWTGTLRAGESLVNTQSGMLGGTHTGFGTSPSTVTQELELVYWKDIKDSEDVQDIELFLTKFPAGVYADLARRKLRNRAGLSGHGSDTGYKNRMLLAPVALAGAVDPDKTIMRPRQAANAAPVESAIDAALPGPSQEAKPHALPPHDVSPVSVAGTPKLLGLYSWWLKSANGTDLSARHPKWAAFWHHKPIAWLSLSLGLTLLGAGYFVKGHDALAKDPAPAQSPAKVAPAPQIATNAPQPSAIAPKAIASDPKPAPSSSKAIPKIHSSGKTNPSPALDGPRAYSAKTDKLSSKTSIANPRCISLLQKAGAGELLSSQEQKEMVSKCQ